MNRFDKVLTFFIGLFSAMSWTSFTLVLMYTLLTLANTLGTLFDIDTVIRLIGFLKHSRYGLFSITKLGLVILFIYALPALLLQLTFMSIITKHEEIDDDDSIAEFIQMIGVVLGLITTLYGGYIMSRMF